MNRVVWVLAFCLPLILGNVFAVTSPKCDDVTVTRQELRNALDRLKNIVDDPYGDIHDPMYPRLDEAELAQLSFLQLSEEAAAAETGPNAANVPMQYGATSYVKGEGLPVKMPTPPGVTDPKADIVSKLQKGRTLPLSAMMMVEGGAIMGSCNAGNQNMRWDAPDGNKHCYMLFTEKKTFVDAQRKCESLGAHLVTITSKDEEKFVSGFPALHQFADWEGPWIGYTDARNEGDWEWITGEVAVIGDNTVFTDWFPDQPDNCCGGEDCAQVSGGHWGMMWNDAKCDQLLPYICERSF